MARFRICLEANTLSILAIDGNSEPSASPSSVRVVEAPTLQAEAPADIRLSSGTASVDTRSGKAAPFLVTMTPSSVAPATILASARSARRPRSPSREPGRTRRESPAE